MFHQIFAALFGLITPDFRPQRPAVLGMWRGRDGTIIPDSLDGINRQLADCPTGRFDPVSDPLPAVKVAKSERTGPSGTRLAAVALVAAHPGDAGTVQAWAACPEARALVYVRERRNLVFTGRAIGPDDPARLDHPVINGLERLRAQLTGTKALLIATAADCRSWEPCIECGTPTRTCQCHRGA